MVMEVRARVTCEGPGVRAAFRAVRPFRPLRSVGMLRTVRAGKAMQNAGGRDL